MYRQQTKTIIKLFLFLAFSTASFADEFDDLGIVNPEQIVDRSMQHVRDYVRDLSRNYVVSLDGNIKTYTEGNRFLKTSISRFHRQLAESKFEIIETLYFSSHRGGVSFVLRRVQSDLGWVSNKNFFELKLPPPEDSEVYEIKFGTALIYFENKSGNRKTTLQLGQHTAHFKHEVGKGYQRRLFLYHGPGSPNEVMEARLTQPRPGFNQIRYYYYGVETYLIPPEKFFEGMNGFMSMDKGMMGYLYEIMDKYDWLWVKLQ